MSTLEKYDHNHEHVSHRINWLRAVTLGANDGIISIVSLMVSMAAANTNAQVLLLTGVAGLTAGALSMAAGEYVSVSSQADAQKAELQREEAHLQQHPDLELDELTRIYTGRGVEPSLARQVSIALMQHDALDAHARDELGITEMAAAKPVQAAFVSALSFLVGGLVPFVAALIMLFLNFTAQATVAGMAASALTGLVLTGVFVAWASVVPVAQSVLRIVFWGVLAIGFSWGIGLLFNLQSVA